MTTKNSSKEKEDLIEKVNEEDLEKVIIEDYKVKLMELDGVGPSTAEKLVEGGYTSYMSIATSPSSTISEKTGIGEGICGKAIRSARSKLNIGFTTATNFLEERKNIQRFTTGCKALNELVSSKELKIGSDIKESEINDGIELGSIYELAGEFRTGKTQIAHQLCITVQLSKDKGGLDAEALYIDTEGTFRPERLLQIAHNKYPDDLDIIKVTDRIHYVRVFNSEHQILMLQKIPELLSEHNNIKLIVVDSIISHLRAEYTGRGTLAERQQLLNKQLHELARLAYSRKIAIVLTNQVSTQVGGYITYNVPTGGHIMGHASTFRILLKKSKDNKRIAKLFDSPSLAEKETAFKITANGIEDI